MAGSAAFSVLLVITALVMADAAGRGHLRSDETNVLAICNHASFPKMCRALIPTLPHPITATSLTEAAVRKAQEKGEEAKAADKKYMAAPETTQNVKGALRVCYKSFNTSVGRLTVAGKLLKELGLHEKVMNKLQGALAILADCDDAFSEFHGTPSPVAHITKNLETGTSNSLSLAIGAY